MSLDPNVVETPSPNDEVLPDVKPYGALSESAKNQVDTSVAFLLICTAFRTHSTRSWYQGGADREVEPNRSSVSQISSQTTLTYSRLARTDLPAPIRSPSQPVQPGTIRRRRS